jgi:BirA family biotin operon repressor/biotin-[acetyl-CoA-carboxylase] ligase
MAVAVTIGDAHHGEVLATEFEAAPQAALMFSFFVTPQRDKNYWSFLPLLSGLAVHHALHELDGSVKVDVKWPNDLFIGDKKTAGLIAQTAGDGVVIGIGINVDMNESELPVPIATSLGLHDFAVLDRNVILATILKHFQELFTAWDSGQDFVDEYTAVSSTIGAQVQATLPGGVVEEGRATSIDHHGALILDDRKKITAGDVIHLR